MTVLCELTQSDPLLKKSGTVKELKLKKIEKNPSLVSLMTPFLA